MSEPIVDSSNPSTEELRHAGYDIQLYVDGVEVPEHRLSRVHLAVAGDKVTLSGTAIMKLTRNDVVQLRLKTRGLRAKTYRIPARGATMSAQLLRWY